MRTCITKMTEVKLQSYLENNTKNTQGTISNFYSSLGKWNFEDHG